MRKVVSVTWPTEKQQQQQKKQHKGSEMEDRANTNAK